MPVCFGFMLVWVLHETKPIMEQLSDIVDQVTNEDQETNVKLME